MLPQQNKHFPKRQPSRLFSLIFLLTWLAALGLIFVNRQGIFDWWQLRNYDPPVKVSALATQTTLTDSSRRVFYVNKPAIEDKSSFNKSCPSGSREQTIVLGCYHSNQQGIFLLDVTDPRLNGVEQVTAAHELLHAEYDRLDSAEKDSVNAMLMDYYEHGLTDERVKNTIDAYKKSEPDDVVNEMHSIFGTEIDSLPADLEQYYKRYFQNRAQVVAYANKYQAEFSSREDAIDNYDRQLESLKNEINNLQDSLDQKQSSIDSERQRLVELRNSSSFNEYNAGVPIYNNMVNSYNAQVQALRGLIVRYNQLVSSRNAIALEEGELVNALDSKVQTINQ